MQANRASRGWPAAAFGAGGLLVVACVGCQGGIGPRFLNLIGLSQKPLVTTLVVDQSEPAVGLVQLVNPFTPYRELYDRMGRALDRAVVHDMCLPFQLGPNLELGIAHLALVSPVQYLALGSPEPYRVLAVTADEKGRTARRAMLITAAGSPIESVEALRGRTVAFGPGSDGRTRHAGLLLLREHGLARTDLSLEVLPVPGSLKSFPKSKDVAQSVLNGSSDAGFIDEAYWESLPEIASEKGQPARSRFRVLGETIAVPEQLVIASPVLPQADVERIREFLLNVGRSDPEALRPLAISGFEPATPELLTACMELTGLEPLAAPPPGEDPATTAALTEPQ